MEAWNASLVIGGYVHGLCNRRLRVAAARNSSRRFAEGVSRRLIGCLEPDMSSGRQTRYGTQGHATQRPSFSSSGGTASAQVSRAIGQRVRKAHPEGLFIGLGTSPTR